MERVAAVLLRLRLAGELGDRDAGTPGEALDRFRKVDALGLHHELEDVAVPARRKVVVEALLVVDEERWRALLVEGRKPLPFPPRLAQLDPAADDVRHRQPGAQLVEELRRGTPARSDLLWNGDAGKSGESRDGLA